MELHAGEACIVPKGEWHRVHVLEKTQLVHIAQGQMVAIGRSNELRGLCIATQ
jgi:quercetin dioxygenase-like cupin family protein